MSMLFKMLLMGSLFFATGASIAAPVFNFDITNPKGSSEGGKILNINSRFDSNNNRLSWSHTMATRNNQLSDGFWLVLSAGPNPKKHKDEFAIFYGDAKNNRLTAYTYNGVNSSNSWNNPGVFLDNFSLSVDDSIQGQRTFRFNIDANALNDASNWDLADPQSWVGATFGEQIGVWLHPALHADFDYANDGRITNAQFRNAGYYDVAYETANPVPEPSTVLLFAAGLLALILYRRQRAIK